MEFFEQQISWCIEPFKRVTIKFFLDKYLGRYLEHLNYSQLNFELYKGLGTIDDIPLAVDKLNDDISSLLPLKFTDGQIKHIELYFPWHSLLTESCALRIEGVQLNLYKLERWKQQAPGSFLSQSLMTSSMKIAEDIVKQEINKSPQIEGLDKFAKFINSVIRRFKVFLNDITIKIVLPNKRSGAGQEIELRIGSIYVEEEEISIEKNDNSKDSQNAFSDLVTKRVTVEGIQILINDKHITKLFGKHTVKVQLDEKRIDIEAYLGSYIFAILNSDHLKVLQEFFDIFDNKGSFGAVDNTKPLDATDYQIMQQMLKIEDHSKKHNPMSSSILSNNGKNWTSDSAHDESEDCFMPFTPNQTAQNKHHLDPAEQPSRAFKCELRIPGIILCLTSQEMPAFDELPMIDNFETFIGINSFLNDILHDYDHLRAFASNLYFDISPESFKVSCINVSLYEYHEENLSPILETKDSEPTGQTIRNLTKPSVSLELINKKIQITLDPTAIKLDLTLLERHFKLFNVFGSSNSSKANNRYATSYGHNEDEDLTVSISCEKLEIEMYFPIPDLRTERDQYSNLHEEILLIELHNLEVAIDPKEVNLVCSQVGIFMKIDDKVHKVFRAQSDNKDITLQFSAENPAVRLPEPLDNECLLRSTNMMESINYLSASTMNPSKTNTPFEVKRKMCDAEMFEQLVTPGDRDHMERYIGENKEATKLYVYIHLPRGEVFLKDKAMFELIYNRFVNDLVLWSPNFPKEPEPTVPGQIDTANLLFESNAVFTSATTDSVINYERSDSLTENMHVESSSLTLQDNVFLQSPTLASLEQAATTFFSFRGMGQSIDSVASDCSYHSITNSTHPGVNKPSNEFVLELEIKQLDMEFFTESGGRNNISTENLLLGIVAGPDSERNTVLSLCCENVEYKFNNKTILTSNTFSSDNTSVINMALDIKRETDTLKKIKLAVQLERALLMGLDLPVYEELFNFVNLKDDDILGYVCPKVVLELHTDIVKSGISFDNLKDRPALLHCEDIYLTSMVIENMNQTILRFFIEEALLSFKRNNMCQDTMKNFITVIDSGVIDLNLTISKDGKNVLKASNNIINVKGCADSLATLCLFLQSFAAQVGPEPLDVEEEVAGQNEIFMRKNTFNGPELIADALLTTEESNDTDGSEDDDSFIRTNCSNCQPIDESQFFLLGDDDYGSGINLNKEPKVRVLTDESPKLMENYFKISNYNTVPEITTHTIARYFLEKLSLHLSLYDGKDFDDIPTESEDTMDDRRSAKLDVISQANMSMRSGKSSMNGTQPKVRFSNTTSSMVWEDINISNNNAYLSNTVSADTHYNYKCSGGAKRKLDTCVQFKLDKIKLLFDLFDKDYIQAWNFWFSIEEIEILDFVSVSRIKKILYEYVSESNPSRKHSNMFSIKMACNRNFQDMNEECDLRVKMKNLRINIDQDTLIFLMEFVTNLGAVLASATAKAIAGQATTTTTTNGNVRYNSDSSDTASMSSLSKTHGDSKNSLNDEMSQRSPKEDFFADEDDDESIMMQQSPPGPSPMAEIAQSGRMRRDSTTSSNSSSLDKLFIKDFQFINEVLIRLDYQGKHIDLKQGALQGVFMGLTSLNQSELKLKKLSNKHGLLGLDKVIAYAVEEWARDIKRNQLPSILGGVGPMHDVILLVQGLRNLFWMPIDQYRRDQRIVRGIQRGAYAFTISTAMATLELANRVVYILQASAQFAHDVVTPPTPGGHNNRSGQMMIHNSQPRDLKEGLTKAYTVMREGMHDIKRGVTNAGMMSDDMSTVFGEVVRQIPSTIVSPFIHLTQATSSVLVGMRNQLIPEARKDDHEKWKNANER